MADLVRNISYSENGIEFQTYHWDIDGEWRGTVSISEHGRIKSMAHFSRITGQTIVIDVNTIQKHT